eukprot:11927280-Prorocentrum_lima.AAC.1
MVVHIGDDQGTQMDMYNRKFRWSGSYDIVDYMCGTNILGASKISGRLLQTYRAMNHLPDGVDCTYHWVIGPPCAGLQDLA